jgi:hypothetical protein
MSKWMCLSADSSQHSSHTGCPRKKIRNMSDIQPLSTYFLYIINLNKVVSKGCNRTYLFRRIFSKSPGGFRFILKVWTNADPP